MTRFEHLRRLDTDALVRTGMDIGTAMALQDGLVRVIDLCEEKAACPAQCNEELYGVAAGCEAENPSEKQCMECQMHFLRGAWEENEK